MLMLQQRMRKADSENLVRPDGAIWSSVIAHNVVEATVLFVPEDFKKSGAGAFRECGIMSSLLVVGKARRQPFHHAQGVVPERLNLHRFAAAGRYHPIANFGVHPGELHTVRARAEQSVRIHVDAVARAALMPD